MQRIAYKVEPIVTPNCGCAIGSCGNKPVEPN